MATQKSIPKILHYCWFGNGEKNKKIQACMKSWKRYCKDYTIMEWNEKTFDLNNAPLYVKEAYEMKKWAFVSDYVRLWALYNYGGVYVDTDVEIIKPLDNLLIGDGSSGFSEIREGDFQIPAAVMTSKKHNPYIRYLLSYYKTRSFKLKGGQLDLKANVYIITEMTMQKFKFKLDNTYQKIKNYEYYPAEYFTPKFEHHRYRPIITKNTYAIHYHNESWMPWYEKVKIDFLILLSYLGIKKPLRWIFYKTGVLK
jgi:mannosyltransferase OCH1-like enzyme